MVFNPDDETTFPGVTDDARRQNYNQFWKTTSLGEKIQMMWGWGIIKDMFTQQVWWKDKRLTTGNWEINERARIEAEVMERKRQKETKAKAEGELARQQEERAELSLRLKEAVAADDTAQEIELRLQIARLDKGAVAKPPCAGA